MNFDTPTPTKCWRCQGYGTTLGAGPDRGNPECSECNGTGVMRGDPAAPPDSIRRHDVPCPECRGDA